MDGSGGKSAVYGPQLGGWRSQTLLAVLARPTKNVLDNPRIASTTDTGAAASSSDVRQLRSRRGGIRGNVGRQDRHGINA